MLRPITDLTTHLLDILQIKPMMPESLTIVRPPAHNHRLIRRSRVHPSKKESWCWLKQRNRNRSFNRGK